MDRRKFLQGALAAPMLGTLASSAQAQAWPTRNISIIVPFPPGGQAVMLAVVAAGQAPAAAGVRRPPESVVEPSA